MKCNRDFRDEISIFPRNIRVPIPKARAISLNFQASTRVYDAVILCRPVLFRLRNAGQNSNRALISLSCL